MKGREGKEGRKEGRKEHEGRNEGKGRTKKGRNGRKRKE